MIFASLLILIAALPVPARGNYFKEIEQLLVSERAKVATQKLGEDLAGGADSPKEISIYCPSVTYVFVNSSPLS